MDRLETRDQRPETNPQRYRGESRRERKLVCGKARAQSMIEMVIVSTCVILVLLSMGTYVRQAMSGKMRGMIDSASEGQFDPATGKYLKAYNTSGTSSSNLRTERMVYTGGDINSSESYVVLGNRTLSLLGNNTVAEVLLSNQSAGPEAGGAPLNTTEVEHYEAGWQDMELK